MKKVGVLGLWHLGCVYSTCLAEQGFSVVGFDFDKKVIGNLQKNIPPIFEPGLEGLIKKHVGKNLSFTDSIKQTIEGKDYVFITQDTLVNKHDVVLMASFKRLAKEVEKYLQPKAVLVITSQVPVGTCRDIKKSLKRAGKKNAVLCLPENLRLGQAIDGFLKPDRIVLGGEEEIRRQFLSDFTFFNCPVLGVSLESAEMSKHALNSYLALLISFGSEISDLCERLGADANAVMSALKTDHRVSPKAPLSPGLGFSGGTLGRDLQTLRFVSKSVNYTPKLVRAVYQVNQDRLPKFVKKISSILGSLKGKKIGLLGLTYKPNTNTLRRSQSLDLAARLYKNGANIRAIDPAIKTNLPELKNLEVSRNYNTFFKGLDAVVLMTIWEEFKSLKPGDFSRLMKQKIVFDARNFLDKEEYEGQGFLYISVGSRSDKQLKD